MSAIYQAESGSVEVVPVVITTVSDPTGGDAPEFEFSRGGTVVPWVAGTWGTWHAATGEVVVLTPTLPAATASVPLAVGRWLVRVRFDVGGESPIYSPGLLVVS